MNPMSSRTIIRPPGPGTGSGGHARWKTSAVRAGLLLCLWLALPAQGHGAEAPPAQAPGPGTSIATNALTLHEVLDSVRRQYPPMLAALIERDVAAGRLQSAKGTFDFQFFSRLFDTPSGYYQSTSVDTGFEQFTGIWGSTLFGGYRITRGGVLPDYDKSRTQGSGEPRIGFRLPLLRDGSIDRRRANLIKARLDKELADPIIHRQQIDFIRAATAGYYGWLAAGERLRLSERLLRIARERMSALRTQAESGLIPRIVLTDNQRLIGFQLRKAGANVTIVENGRLAVEALTVGGSLGGPCIEPPPFDVVLSDMQMPEMDGYAATRLLRSLGCRLPIIAVTAHAMNGDAERCLEAGCDAYATKPVDRDRLARTILDSLKARVAA